MMLGYLDVKNKMSMMKESQLTTKKEQANLPVPLSQFPTLPLYMI